MENPNLVLSSQAVELNNFNEAANFIILCKGGDTSLAADFLRQVLNVVQPDSYDNGGSRKKPRLESEPDGESLVEPSFESLDFSYVLGDDVDSKASSTVLLVPNRAQLLGAIIGKGGSFITHIQTTTGSKVQIEKKEVNSGTNTQVSITGSIKNNNAAVALIINKVNYHLKVKEQGSDPAASSIKMIVPNAMVRYLIGRGGSVINELQATSEAHIQFQPEKEMVPGSLGREVVINQGDFTKQVKAEYLIARKMVVEAKFDPNWATSIGRTPQHSGGAGSQAGQSAPRNPNPTPSGYGGGFSQGMGADPTGMMSGLGGLGGLGALGGGYDPSVLLQLQQQQQQAQLLLQLQQQLAGGAAALQPSGGMYGGLGVDSGSQQQGLPPPGMPPGMNQGMPQGMGDNSSSSVDITVPNWCVSRLIGRGGSTIQEMQQKTGAKIQYQKEHEMLPGTSERKVTLSGNSSSVAAAQQLLQSTVQQLQASQMQQQN